MSSNLFSNPTTGTRPGYNFAPSTYDATGLRQRRPTDAKHNETATVDENTNPNNVPLGTSTYGKRDVNTAKPPPRASLATSGKNALRGGPVTAASVPQAPAPTDQTSNRDSHSHALAIVPKTKHENESSLWVVAYGFRTHAHLKSIMGKLVECGSITARKTWGDGGSNWVALRYSNSLSAHKAMCQNGNVVSVGGSPMIFGVMSFNDLDAAAKLGIDIYSVNTESQDLLLHSLGRGLKDQFMIDDSEVMLGSGGDEMDVCTGASSGLCGKVLAWFFGW